MRNYCVSNYIFFNQKHFLLLRDNIFEEEYKKSLSKSFQFTCNSYQIEYNIDVKKVKSIVLDPDENFFCAVVWMSTRLAWCNMQTNGPFA